MAIFRKVHTSFWSDSFTGELDTEKKLFYLYLITNEKTSACGIYEIRKKQISFDLGYSTDTVSKLLEYFIKCDKIMYNEETSEIALKNWYKYNPPSSPKIQSCINKELKLVKDTVLIQYVNGIYTQSLKDKDQDKDQEKEREREIDQDTDITAYDFLIQNCSIQLDQIWMKNSKLLEQKDEIIHYFNNKVDLEGIEYTNKKLISRLNILFGNWNKNDKQQSKRKPIAQLTDNEILSMTYHEMMDYGEEGRIQIEQIKHKIYAAL